MQADARADASGCLIPWQANWRLDIIFDRKDLSVCIDWQGIALHMLQSPALLSAARSTVGVLRHDGYAAGSVSYSLAR